MFPEKVGETFTFTLTAKVSCSCGRNRVVRVKVKNKDIQRAWEDIHDKLLDVACHKEGEPCSEAISKSQS